MKYKLHNAASIREKEDREKSKTLIKKQITKIERIADSYPKNLQVDLYFNSPDKLNYSLKALVKLKDGVVLIKEKGENTEAIIHSLFDRLKLQLTRKIHKERKSNLRRQRGKRIEEFKAYFPELKESVREETSGLSNQLMSIILQDLSRYVERRIRSAEMTSAIRKGKFNLQEILDDIYLIAYERIPDIAEKALHNNAWIYHIADDYLAGLFQEIKFEKEHFERLEHYVEAEYQSNRVLFTFDAEQKIIPTDELDGHPEHPEVNLSNDLFVGETENSLLDGITLKINQTQINHLIQKEIAKLPLNKRTTMELFLIDQMTVDEIASIKKQTQAEVEGLIKEVSEDLKGRLLALL